MRKISMKRKSRTPNSETSEHKDDERSSDEDTNAKEDDSLESENEEKEEPVKKGGKKSRKSKKGGKSEENGTDKNDKKSKKSKEKDKEPESEEGEKDEDDEDEQYEVDAVMDDKMVRGVRHYLIKWKGYDNDGNTWEPESTLSCLDLIEEYNKTKPESPSKKRSKSTKDKSNKKRKPESKSSKGEDDDEDDDDEPSDTEYEVDKIIDVYYKKNGKREFLVHWKGYGSQDNTWEPEDNMTCKELIEKFMNKVDKAKSVQTRELRISRVQTDRFTLNMQDKGRKLSRRNLDKQRVHYYDAE